MRHSGGILYMSIQVWSTEYTLLHPQDLIRSCLVTSEPHASQDVFWQQICDIHIQLLAK